MKDPIDSRQLHIFLALAKKGSLRAAAAELYLTTSAISHSIHNLEASLGTKLFYRPGKTLELTERGHFLLREAGNILSSMDRLRQQLTGDESLNQSTFRVAAGYNYLGRLLPEVVREWQLCFPKARLVAQGADRDECLKLLEDDEIEAAVLVDAPSAPSLEVNALFEDQLRVVVASSNPLARLEAVTLRNLHGKTLLVSRIQCHTTRLVLAEMRRNGFDFRECIEMGSAEAVNEMVRVGDAVSLNPEWVQGGSTSGEALVSKALSQANITRRWAHVSRADKPMGLMQRTFLRLCKRVSEKAMTSRVASLIFVFLSGVCTDELIPSLASC